MRPKSLILLALALGCGLVASIGISQVMDKNGSNAGPAVETEAIFIAKVDIPDGQAITAENVDMEQWPKAKIPTGACMKAEDWTGQKAKATIYKGDVVAKAKFLDKNEQPANKIPPGFRTVAIPVDAGAIAGGLIKPRDKVDVLAMFSRNPQNGISESKVVCVLQKIEVFAVDSQYKRGENGTETVAKVVSLLVTPKQAEMVTLAEQTGKIRLALRNGDDEKTDVTDNKPTVFGDLGHSDGVGPVVPPTTPIVQPAPATNVVNDILGMLARPATPEETAIANEKKEIFTMILMEGNHMKEVDFNLTDGGLPVVRTTEGPGGSPLAPPKPLASPEVMKKGF